MERPHYRQHTPPRQYGSPQQPKKTRNIHETILRQCIVSGIIFSFVLLFNLVNTELSQNIRNSLKAALSRNTSVADMMLTVGKVTETFTEMENSVKTIMGNTPDEADGATVPVPEEQPEQALDDEQLTSPAPEFRIDEDILEAINNRVLSQNQIQD